jgi:hypothetical protein
MSINDTIFPDFPRHVRHHRTNDTWEGADHPDGPWWPIPALQLGLPWKPSRQGSNPPPPGNKPAPPASPPTADLVLRVQRLEAMRETEKAAILEAFRQIDDLKRRLDFQYLKLNKLEESITPEAHD